MEQMTNVVEELKKELNQKFKDLFNAYDRVHRVIGLLDQNEFKNVKSFFSEKRKTITEALKNKYFYIAFIGPYSTGKSTFLNALFNRNILPENDEKATTAFPTYIYTVSSEREEKAIIYYNTDKEREELKRFYLEKVNKEMKLNEDIEDLVSLTNEELVEKIQTQIKNLEKSEETYNAKLVEALERLLKFWTEEAKEPETVTIEQSKQFVEYNEESITINHIDIYLYNDIVSIKDVVLVDLPGVDADNPRHYEVTKRFTMEAGKAHAFVVVTSPNKIENDTLNSYLRELSKKARQLERAFWVVNRCDTSENPENTKLALRDKIIGNKIEILPDRLYATSAKLYKDKKAGQSIPVEKESITRAVDELRNALTEYLSSRVFREFLESQEKEYNNLKQRLVDFLSPRSLHYAGISEEDLKELSVIEAIDEKVQHWFNFQRDKQQEIIFNIKKELNSFYFFDEKLTNKIKQEIVSILDRTTEDEILAQISQVKDVNKTENYEVVRYIRELIPLNEMIRREFQLSLESGYLYDIMLRPKQLLTLDIESIDNPVFRDIDEVLRNDNLKYRLEGLCDAFLKDYVDLTNQIIQGVIDDYEGINKLKAKIVLHCVDDLEKEIIYKGKQSLTDNKPLIEFIISFPTKGELDDIITVKGIDEENVNENGYLTYIKIYSKYAIFGYLEKVVADVNDLVRVSLTNHFKEFRNRLLLLLDSTIVRRQILSIFRKKIQANQDTLYASKQREITFLEVYKLLTT